MNRMIYSFEGFHLDVGKRLLVRNGETIQLSSKAFDLLLTLIQSGGREITKEELMQSVWADQIVEDANLTVTMSHLRKALGEKASDHRFIVTIPGRGYRFVPEVQPREALIVEQHTVAELVEESESTNLATATTPLTETKALGPAKDFTAGTGWIRSPTRTITAAVGAAVLVGVTVFGFFLWSKRAESSTGATTIQIKSIAVLPFKPLVSDNRDESLEMGMADTLIAKLSNITELRIRPISSIRKYAGLEQDAVAAGREQKVDAVLDGQIQKSGQKIRVTVRLVRVADGAPIWTSQFDEKPTDIFAVQDSISERVTAALAIKLTSGEQRGLTKRHTGDLEAYQLYLKARYHLKRLTDDGFFKARDYFQQAIDRDRNYALAYAGLAEAYNMLGNFDTLAPKESFPKARDAAEAALKLDESLAEAHAALGVVKLSYDWEFRAAEREFRRALEIDPNYSDGHTMNGYYLVAMGRFDEALIAMKRAQELDPLSLEKIIGVGEVIYFQRRYDQTIAQYKSALEMEPNSGFTHWELGRTFAAQGKYDEAIAEFQKSIPLSGESPDEPAELARAYALSGRRPEALKIVEELKRLSDRKHVAPTVMASIYGALGDKDQAFALLDKALGERDFLLVLLNVEPIFDPLRSDPRFPALVQRVGLPK